MVTRGYYGNIMEMRRHTPSPQYVVEMGILKTPSAPPCRYSPNDVPGKNKT